MIRRAVNLVIGAAVVSVLGTLAYYSLRLAVADYYYQQRTIEGIEKAISIEPNNADFHYDLALLQDFNGASPELIEENFRNATELNQRHSKALIESALRHEIHGNLETAERELLHTAAIDKEFRSSWNLANFYFRQENHEKFWPWAKQAVEDSYEHPMPIFRMAWLMSQDAPTILDRVVPDDPKRLAQYLQFLEQTNRLGPAQEVARRAAARATKQEMYALTSYCDRMIRERDTATAVTVWNQLCQRELLPYTPLAPAEGHSLTNGDLRITPLGYAFDWRMGSVNGMNVSRSGNPTTLRIEFSGSQPEALEVMVQTLPVQPRREYELRYRYRTTGIAPKSGLRWRFTDLAGAELGEPVANFSSDDWKVETVRFRAGETPVVRMALYYRRALGTTRITGSAYVQDIRLSFANPARPQ
jgi:hypothetical protein